jgi:hypothetical protein
VEVEMNEVDEGEQDMMADGDGEMMGEKTAAGDDMMMDEEGNNDGVTEEKSASEQQPANKVKKAATKPASQNPTATSSNKATPSITQFYNLITLKLRHIWTGPGPASIIKQIPAFMSLSPNPSAVPRKSEGGDLWSNYIIATVGSILYVYKFNSVTYELDQIAFFFTSVSRLHDFCVIFC